jgi:hypothetical protein
MVPLPLFEATMSRWPSPLRSTSAVPNGLVPTDGRETSLRLKLEGGVCARPNGTQTMRTATRAASRNRPPRNIASFAKKAHQRPFRLPEENVLFTVSSFDHGCCWAVFADEWRSARERLKQAAGELVARPVRRSARDEGERVARVPLEFGRRGQNRSVLSSCPPFSWFEWLRRQGDELKLHGSVQPRFTL